MTRGLVAVLAVLLVAAAPSDSGEEDVTAELVQCMAEVGRLSVQFVVDASGSLQETDPQDRRVVAVQSALGTLELLGQRGDDTSIAVDVAVSAFSQDIVEIVPWQPLTDADQLQRAVEELEELDNGVDTDFHLALTSAQKSLGEQVQRLADQGERTCSIILLFTDGEYDILPRQTASQRERFGATKPYSDIVIDSPEAAQQVEQQGRALLCDDSGVIDQLRQQDHRLYTIAFGQDIASEDLAFLEAMSRGEAGSTSCGSVTSGLGEYVPVPELGLLVAEFDRLASQAGGADTAEPVLLSPCPDETCPAGRYEFALDPTLRQFHLLVSLDSRGAVLGQDIEVGLAGPDGNFVPVRPGGSVEVAGVNVLTSELSPIDLVLDADLEPRTAEQWSGTWTLELRDVTGVDEGAQARAQLSLYGALRASIAAEDVELRAGTTTTIPFDLVTVDGSVVSPTEFGASARVEVEAVVGAGETVLGSEVVTSENQDGGEVTIEVPAEINASGATLTFRTFVETAGGVELRPQTSSFRVPVLPPAGYPVIVSTDVVLSSIEEEGVATGSVTIRGASDSSGCVYFGDMQTPTELPPGVDGISIAAGPTSQDDCLAVEAGAEQSFDLALRPSDVRTGDVRGTLPVVLLSDDFPEPASGGVDYSFSMHRSTAGAIGPSILLIAIATLLPLLLLLMWNWWTARFQEPQKLRRATVPVTSDGRVLRRSDGSGELLTAGEVVAFEPSESGRPRRFTARGTTDGAPIDDLEFGSKVSLWPFTAPIGVVRAGRPVATRRDPGGGATSAKAPFDLTGTWMFRLRPCEHDEVEHACGWVDVWLAEGSFSETSEPVLEAVRADVPPAAVELVEHMGADEDDSDDVQAQEAPAPTVSASNPFSEDLGPTNGTSPNTDPDDSFNSNNPFA